MPTFGTAGLRGCATTRRHGTCGARAIRCELRGSASKGRQADAAGNEAAEGFARYSLNAKQIKAMLFLAESDLPITPAELDTASHLLNFLNGTVDLRTGKLGPHRRSDWLTKIVYFRYRPEAKCPRFLAFLSEIMGGGPDASEGDLRRADELIAFLKAALGYSATGEVTEKVIIVAHGSGDNGKTTLLSVARDLLGDYATTIGLDMLITREESNNVSAARTKLRGVRCAVSSETEEGQWLSAARLKRICQGFRRHNRGMQEVRKPNRVSRICKGLDRCQP
jgi:phage/plasmid-associated DNA primase